MSVWMVYDMVFLLCGCYGLSLCAKVRMSGRLEDRKLGLPHAVHMVTLGYALRRLWFFSRSSIRR